MSHLVRSRWFGFVMGIVCTLALVSALGSATGVWAGTLAQGAQPGAEPAAPEVADVVGSYIPVQGRLTDAGGNPLTGTFSIVFRLYDVPSGGTALCSDTNTVWINNGLFNSEIWGDCGAAEMNGQQLYLGIEVSSDGEMIPRQPIYAVPYAWSLRPGAQIGGTGAGNGSVYLKDASGVTTLGLTASNGLLDLGGVGDDGDIYVRNMTDTITFSADGDTGDVSQALASDGLVKAAVYALCDTSGTGKLGPHFNHVGGTITVINGTTAGRCTIDFGFDVSTRFVTVTAGRETTPHSVTYMNGSNNNRLDFYRWDAAGAGNIGEIIVMVY